MEMARPKKFSLRTPSEISEGYERVFNDMIAGKIDARAGRALGTVLNGAGYLNGKLKLEAAKLYVQASNKGLDIPPEMLPDLRK